MENNAKTTTIWCSYHDQNLLNEYNLKDTKNIKLFWTNDKWNIDGESINDLNKTLSEIVTFYYVWKNQIKSDYVGFCHYRRFFSNVDYGRLSDNHIQSYEYTNSTIYYYPCKIMSEYHLDIAYIYENFFNFMLEKYNIDLRKHYNSMNIHTRLSYIMTWNVFNKVCEFMFGFLDYLCEPDNINWKNYDDHLKLISLVVKIKDEHYIHHQNRAIAVMMELLTGIFIELMYEVDTYNTNNKIIMYDVDNVTIFKLYKLNVKTGITQIINKNVELARSFTEYDKTYNYPYLSFLTEKQEEFIEEYKDNIINLSPIEYIDCEDAIEFTKGNYIIKTI
jgi:hypothetical protein